MLHKDSRTKLEYWKTTCIFELNSEGVVKERKNMLREATELKHIFGKGKPKPVSVLDNQIIKPLDDFKKYEPILTSLLTDGFKPRHWKELAELTKIPLEAPPKASKDRARLTLSHYFQLQLWEKPKELEEVAEKAAKEFQN